MTYNRILLEYTGMGGLQEGRQMFIDMRGVKEGLEGSLKINTKTLSSIIPSKTFQLCLSVRR